MKTDKKRILLVEDEENFGSLLQNYLQLSNYIVDWQRNGALGYSAFKQGHYDLCIFDVMMPHMDGFTLAEKVREHNKDIPFIFLTAKNLKEDQIKGYKVGAVDYLNKPFDVEVLLLKLEVIFSRSSLPTENLPQESEYQIGQFNFDVKKRLLNGPSETKKLSPKESALLELLCQHLNAIMPREIALKKIWKEESYFTTRSMDVYITKLRKYLKEDNKVSIENLHSSGYQLTVD